MSEVHTTPQQQLFHPFQLVTICAGGLVCLFSASQVDATRVDLRLITLFGLALCLGSRVVVRMPRFSSQISLSATFVFLTMLLYGGEYAVLLAATEAFVSSCQLNKKV